MGQLPITLRFKHVRGHQDDVHADLDVWERLNVEMDAASKAHRRAQVLDVPREPRTASSFQLRNQAGTISKFLRRTLLRSSRRTTTSDYWRKKFTLSEQGAATVDWDARSAAFSACSPAIRRFIVKHSTGFSSSGHKTSQIQNTPTGCPFCLEDETEVHIFNCGHERAKTFRKQERAAFFSQMQNKRVPTPLIQALQDLLRDREPDDSQLVSWQKTRYCAYMGCLPCLCTDFFVQDQHSTRRTPQSRMQDVVLALWESAKRIWQFRVDFHLATTAESARIAEEEEIRAKIRNMYERPRTHMSAADRALFAQPLRTLLDNTPQHRKAWLRCAREIHRRIERKILERYGGERMALTAWLAQA